MEMQIYEICTNFLKLVHMGIAMKTSYGTMQYKVQLGGHGSKNNGDATQVRIYEPDNTRTDLPQTPETHFKK